MWTRRAAACCRSTTHTWLVKATVAMSCRSPERSRAARDACSRSGTPARAQSGSVGARTQGGSWLGSTHRIWEPRPLPQGLASHAARAWHMPAGSEQPAQHRVDPIRSALLRPGLRRHLSLRELMIADLSSRVSAGGLTDRDGTLLPLRCVGHPTHTKQLRRSAYPSHE